MPPKKKVATICIVVDDVHPEGSHDSQGLDFGLDIKNGPFKYLLESISRVPGIKFNLFVVPDWTDRSARPTLLKTLQYRLYRKSPYSEGQFAISSEKYASWCRSLGDMRDSGHVAFCLHGLHHACNGSHLEFSSLSLDSALQKLFDAETMFKDAGLKLDSFFRPPGWRMSPGSLKALQKMSYHIAATHNLDRSLDESRYVFKIRVSSVIPTKAGKTLFVTSNCYPHQTARAMEVARMGGVVVIHCHIAKTILGLQAITEKFPQYMHRLVRALSIDGFTPRFVFLRDLPKLTGKIYMEK